MCVDSMDSVKQAASTYISNRSFERSGEACEAGGLRMDDEADCANKRKGMRPASLLVRMIVRTNVKGHILQACL